TKARGSCAGPPTTKGPRPCVVPYPRIRWIRNHAGRDPPHDPRGGLTSRASRDPPAAFARLPRHPPPRSVDRPCQGRVDPPSADLDPYRGPSPGHAPRRPHLRGVPATRPHPRVDPAETLASPIGPA